MGGGAGGRQLLPKHFPRATPSPRLLGIHPFHLPRKPLPLISGFSCGPESGNLPLSLAVLLLPPVGCVMPGKLLPLSGCFLLP